jgi:DNA-binding response OmpR family regulator
MQETILVVDDHPTVLHTVIAILVRAGFKVFGAESGSEALQICRGESPIGLALIDVVMPGVNGTEIRRRLSEELPGLRVLFMSGYDHEGVLACGADVPEADLLRKPFTPAVLVSRVRAALDVIA